MARAIPMQIPGLKENWRKSPLYQEKLSPSSYPASDRFKQGTVMAKAYIGRNAGDHFATLGVNPGTSKQDIKSAYRRLALRYHPDVCKGDHCAPKFKQIQMAYEGAMLITAASQCGSAMYDSSDECASVVSEGLMGVNDDSWEDWEEWMGWEGAGTRDYTSHINVSI
ncbi:hypothetical protein O6H91_07G106200 [Diphasiastrum complanatum]|uniref:Uncharacterized protein n=1 Tax=Diphasiastrum complanatum TaxID=34168 RepID=A0ACC2D8A1_DIPCM|nr:hypothetical protein O6H91_Y109300 [Diphasiastrum complanatum]KAJ7550559.1 hypothetical protein O6H91_07G106200 [Diphasiastrum complanatum]